MRTRLPLLLIIFLSSFLSRIEEVVRTLKIEMKRTIKDNMPSSMHEQFDHLTSNFIGSYRDTFDLTSEDKNAFDPLSYELLHSTDAAIRHFNPKYSQGEIDVKKEDSARSLWSPKRTITTIVKMPRR